MPLEEFFIAASLALGAPNQSAVGWHSRKVNRKQGIGFFLEEHDDGRAFVAFVDSLGEAKRRAAALYKFWLRWYMAPEHERAAYAAKLQNGWPKSYKRMMRAFR